VLYARDFLACGAGVLGGEAEAVPGRGQRARRLARLVERGRRASRLALSCGDGGATGPPIMAGDSGWAMAAVAAMTAAARVETDSREMCRFILSS